MSEQLNRTDWNTVQWNTDQFHNWDTNHGNNDRLYVWWSPFSGQKCVKIVTERDSWFTRKICELFAKIATYLPKAWIVTSDSKVLNQIRTVTVESMDSFQAEYGTSASDEANRRTLRQNAILTAQLRQVAAQSGTAWEPSLSADEWTNRLTTRLTAIREESSAPAAQLEGKLNTIFDTLGMGPAADLSALPAADLQRAITERLQMIIGASDPAKHLQTLTDEFQAVLAALNLQQVEGRTADEWTTIVTDRLTHLAEVAAAPARQSEATVTQMAEALGITIPAGSNAGAIRDLVEARLLEVAKEAAPEESEAANLKLLLDGVLAAIDLREVTGESPQDLTTRVQTQFNRLRDQAAQWSNLPPELRDMAAEDLAGLLTAEAQLKASDDLLARMEEQHKRDLEEARQQPPTGEAAADLYMAGARHLVNTGRMPASREEAIQAAEEALRASEDAKAMAAEAARSGRPLPVAGTKSFQAASGSGWNGGFVGQGGMGPAPRSSQWR